MYDQEIKQIEPSNLRDLVMSMYDVQHTRMILNNFGHTKFKIEEPYPDWTGYEKFSFIVFSKQNENINLEFRINDRQHDYSYYDRFNRTLIIKPGFNKIIIPIEDIKNAPASRPMDLQNIKTIILFTGASLDNLDIYIDDFILE